MNAVRMGRLFGTAAMIAAAVLHACGGVVEPSSEPERDGGMTDASGSSPHPDDDARSRADAPQTSAADAAPPPDLSTVPELAACLASTREIHVTRRDSDAGTETSYDTDGSTSNWIGQSDFDGKAVWVSVAVATGWMIRMNDAVPLTIGRYQTGNPQPAIFVASNAMTVRCASPTGSFTIEDLARPAIAGGSTALDRLAMWFDLACSDGSRIRGCVRYAR